MSKHKYPPHATVPGGSGLSLVQPRSNASHAVYKTQKQTPSPPGGGGGSHAADVPDAPPTLRVAVP